MAGLEVPGTSGSSQSPPEEQTSRTEAQAAVPPPLPPRAEPEAAQGIADKLPLPIGGVTPARSYDAAIQPVPTRLEGIGAAIDDGMDHWFTGALARKYAIDDLNSSGFKKLDPDTLNRQFPYMQNPFSEPMTLTPATYIADQQQERQKRQDLIQRQVDLLGTGSAKAAELVTGVLDPISLAATIITGGVASAGMTAAGIAAPTALAGRLAFGIGENFVGMLPNTIANYKADQAEGAPVTLGGALKENAEGAVLGTIGFKALGWAVGKTAKFISPYARGLAERVGLAQVLEGKKVNLDWLDTVFMRERSGAFPKGQTLAGEIKPTVGGERFYTTDGRTFTDNPSVANALSAGEGSTSPVAQNIYEVDLKSKNLLNLNRPLEESLGESFAPLLKDIVGTLEGAKEVIRTNTAADVLDLIRTGIAEEKIASWRGKEVIDNLKRMGFDGVIYNPAGPNEQAFSPMRTSGQDVMPSASFDSSVTQPHAMVHLFDEHLPKDKVKAVFSGDPKLLPEKLTTEELQKVAQDNESPTNKVDFDQRAQDNFRETMAGPDPAPQPSQVDKLATEAVEELKSMADNKFIDPKVKEELDGILKEHEAFADEETIVEQASQCFRRFG